MYIGVYCEIVIVANTVIYGSRFLSMLSLNNLYARITTFRIYYNLIYILFSAKLTKIKFQKLYKLFVICTLEQGPDLNPDRGLESFQSTPACEKMSESRFCTICNLSLEMAPIHIRFILKQLQTKVFKTGLHALLKAGKHCSSSNVVISLRFTFSRQV